MRVFLAHAFALAGAVALTACDLAPRDVRPAPGVPARIARPDPAPSAAEEGASDPADIAWRDFFDDARLRGVIALGLAHNRDLAVAIANVEQARALFHVRRAALLPDLQATGTATYQDYPQGTPLNGAGAAGGRADIYTLGGGVSSWEIDLFGRVRNLSRSAREQYFASAANRDAARTALVAEIATAWLTLAADRERLTIARLMESAFGQTSELIRARFAKGAASGLELSQAETSEYAARADVAALSAIVAQDRNALDLLAGTAVDDDLLPDRLGEQSVTFRQLPADLPSTALLRRPDIAAAEHRLRAANADIGAARAAFFPRISLTAAVGTMSMGLSNLFAEGGSYWSVAPSGAMPIFDFGRTRGNLRYAKATRDAMTAQYQHSVQVAFREVADALARRATIGAEVEAQESRRSTAANAYRLSDARWRAGVDPFLIVLDAQRSLYGAENGLVATRLARETNAVELYRALGGGLK